MIITKSFRGEFKNQFVMMFKKIASLVKIFRNYYSLYGSEVNPKDRIKRKKISKIKKVVVYDNVNYLHKRTTYQQKEKEREAVGEEMMMIIDKNASMPWKVRLMAHILI